MTARRIAFLGIGLMGARQAARLLAAGHAVRVWNRTAEKTEPLAAQGATAFADAGDAVEDAEIVITMLAKGDTVAEVLFGGDVADRIPAGAVVVDMSSIAPAEARAHASRLAARGVHHLDAPVSGGTKGAAEGTLAIMAGGDPAVFEAVRPVLEAMGRPTLVGPAGAGQVAKLANQMIVAVTIGAVAEALVLAERAGADPAAVRDALRGGFAESRILELHGARMIAQDFVPGGRTSLQIKDLENALATAAESGAPSPFSGLALDLFRNTFAAFGDVDHAGLWLTLHEPKQ